MTYNGRDDKVPDIESVMVFSLYWLNNMVILVGTFPGDTVNQSSVK
jgi:hypothetical protein